MEPTLPQSILLLLMGQIESSYPKELSRTITRPLAEAFDALAIAEGIMRTLHKSKGGGV